MVAFCKNRISILVHDLENPQNAPPTETIQDEKEKSNLCRILNILYTNINSFINGNLFYITL